jgi:hypothetical protein
MMPLRPSRVPRRPRQRRVRTIFCRIDILLRTTRLLRGKILTLHIIWSTGKYTAILAILVVGSFIIPMAQYFWYVRDDDSAEEFFAKDVPEPKKKKGWF